MTDAAAAAATTGRAAASPPTGGTGPIVITGGAGFIGSHLLERLLREPGPERPVFLVDDLSTGLRGNVAAALERHPRVRLLEGRAGQVLASGAVPLEGADVYHLAASVGVSLVMDAPAKMLENNLTETASVLNAAASGRARRVLLASSSEVYGRCVDPPLREDGPLVFGPTTAARWSYGMAKALDEHLALDLHRRGVLEPVVVRFFNTIGPRQRGRYGMVVPRFVAAAAAGRPLHVHGDGRQRRTFCDVRDVVEALVRLMACDAAAGEVVNVGGNTPTTIRGLAERVVDLAAASGTARTSRIVTVPYEAVYGPDFEDPADRAPDLSKVRHLIGWQSTRTLDQTLADLLQDTAEATPPGPPPDADDPLLHAAAADR